MSSVVFLVAGYFLSISLPIPARLFIHYPIRYSCYKNTLVNNLEKIRVFFYQIYSYFVWGRGGIFLYQIFLYRDSTVCSYLPTVPINWSIKIFTHRDDVCIKYPQRPLHYDKVILPVFRLQYTGVRPAMLPKWYSHWILSTCVYKDFASLNEKRKRS